MILEVLSQKITWAEASARLAALAQLTPAGQVAAALGKSECTVKNQPSPRLWLASSAFAEVLENADLRLSTLITAQRFSMACRNPVAHPEVTFTY